MDLRTYLMQSPDLSVRACVDAFAADWTRLQLAKGAHLARQDEGDTAEYILLRGSLAATICDSDGKEICVGFYVGPCVVTPNIARTRDGVSRVSLAATQDAVLARIDSARLSTVMQASEPVRDWANAALRDALSRKADREWCLAALGGADRLAWFRGTFAGYEEIFSHTLIASFLGVTPVTLSRLRARGRHQR